MALMLYSISLPNAGGAFTLGASCAANPALPWHP